MGRIRNAQSVNKVNSKEILWKVAGYIRLSREDGNDESLSVTNQRKIILDELGKIFDCKYELVDFFVDDGLTGTDYDRPEFQRMIHEMETGAINCIVVKDLSRMFRNYSDQGYFLEKVFPTFRIRFITIGDPKVDSYLHPEAIEGLEVPINGLMNDRYAAKTSKDVRRTFNYKRRKGEFIGAFAPYGYQKDPEDKNKLIIDEEAAQVVRDIFHWFVGEGMSQSGIAKRLNDAGIPNPAAFKKLKGLKYANPESHKNDGLWCSSTIRTVLKNLMYIGTMVQGKQLVVSYKVHDRISTSKEDWYIVPDTHEPIIDQDTFDKAQSLLTRDTRTAPQKRSVHLFAGFIRCADCGKAMNRSSAKGAYHYYSCRTFREKSKSKCTKHSTNEDTLKQIVLTTIQKQIALVESLAEIIEAINQAPSIKNQSSRLSTLLVIKQKEYSRVTNLIDGLYGDWKSGEITKDEYRRFKAKYEDQVAQLKQVIDNIQKECDIMAQGIRKDDPYLASFLKYRNITTLERGILVDLVNNIFIHQDGQVEIEFNFADQYLRIVDFIEGNCEGLNVSGNEAS